MFGVIVCPRCRKAKGVDLKQKTTTCSCGFEIRVVPERIRTRAETARAIAPLVGRVNAEIAGGLNAYDRAQAPKKRARVRDVHGRVIAAVTGRGDRAARVRAAAAELSNELELFTIEDWTKVLAGLGISNPEASLEALVRSNAVFEPKRGYYRIVSPTA